jgi:hypothetical protein
VQQSIKHRPVATWRRRIPRQAAVELKGGPTARALATRSDEAEALHHQVKALRDQLERELVMYGDLHAMKQSRPRPWPASRSLKHGNATTCGNSAASVAYPIGPLLCLGLADRFERKWQIVAAAAGTATFGLLFVAQTAPLAIIGLGVLITLSNNLLSYAYHAYQAELFPTRIRARAVGFVYSWSRLSTVFTSLMIGFFLDRFGTPGVFGFIAASMAVVCVSIGAFGPLTRSLALEEIS